MTAIGAECDPLCSRIGAQLRHVRIIAVRQDRIARCHLLNSFAKCIDDRVQVGVDVRVIEFDVVDDQSVGPVVQKFRTLVEECRVVLVAFYDELGALSQLEILVEIEGNAANDHARIASRGLEHPGHERSGGRFPVRAGDDNRVFPFDEELVNRLGHRCVRQVHLQRRFSFRIRARSGIADDHQIGPKRLQMLARIPFENRDAETLEVCRHRRIDVLIRAADFVAALLQHAGERGHCGAADSDQINAFDLREFFDVRHCAA